MQRITLAMPWAPRRSDELTRCLRTVDGLMPRRLAISLLVSPSATNAMTCRSRRLNATGAARSSTSFDAKDTLMACATSCTVLCSPSLPSMFPRCLRTVNVAMSNATAISRHRMPRPIRVSTSLSLGVSEVTCSPCDSYGQMGAHGCHVQPQHIAKSRPIREPSVCSFKLSLAPVTSLINRLRT